MKYTPICWRLTLSALVIPLSACSSMVKPNFYKMSDEELAAYNSNVVNQEQVRCVHVQISFDQALEKICGTLDEIQAISTPQAPGARNERAFPLLEIDSRSRATNPQLRPTTQPRPL